jgi:hypothetical protein
MVFQESKQKAVLWEVAGFGDDGDPTVNSPVEIDVRWEHGLNQFVGPDGTPVGVVASLWVDQEIEVGSVVWKGKLFDMPAAPDSLYEVVGYEDIPDVKGRNSEKVVHLRRLKESLPTVV